MLSQQKSGFFAKFIKRHWALGYGLALVLFGATIALSLLLTYLSVKINLTIPVVFALVAAAWYGGRGPGLLIAFLFETTTVVFTPIPPGSTIANAAFGYFSVFSLYVFLVFLITGLQRTRDALKIRARQQASVASFGQEALASIPLDELLPRATQLVRQTLGVDYSAVCELVPGQEKLRYTAGSGWLEDVVGFEFDYGTARSMAGRVVQDGEPVVANDLNVDDRFEVSEMLTRHSVRSAAGVKILHRGKALGVLGAFARQPRAFSKDDLNFLQSIANIIAEADSRLKVEDEVREQREWLQTTLSSIGEGVIATDRDGVVTFMNPVAEAMTGWQDMQARGRLLDEVFHTIDEETRKRVATPVKEVIRTGSIVGLANHTRLISKNGRETPIDDSAAPIRDGDTIKGVVMVFADVSERKTAERSRRENEIMHRIVEAQEAERHRIARDLHDHLGQKMTGLRLQIEGLTEKCTADSPVRNALVDLQESASHIDRDIGFLSWELRPTELENLGLVNALGSFVREWTSQHSITSEFHSSLADTGDLASRLPDGIETNLYRIVQEALNNVLKHADAQNVNVLLQQRRDQVVLIVEDDGRGFESDIHRTDGTTPGGLGLIGMQERAALLNGELEIDSAEGKGTTLMVRIPLADTAVV